MEKTARLVREHINALKDIVRHPYAFPGGYEKVMIMNDGGVLCGDCAKSEYKNILHSTKFEYRDGWDLAGIDVNWEGTDLHCDHCNKLLPPEYGE